MAYIKINNKNYILAQDIINDCPVWCKGIRNGRELIKKKEIDDDNFIYARLVDDEWKETNGASIKFDKVLVRAKYIESCQEYVAEAERENYDIIELSEKEKIKDNDGEIFDVEVRGTRKYDNIYFKAEDIADLLKMPSLIKTLTDNRNTNSYKENIDYKYIKCDDGKNQIYLTYSGMFRVFTVSRNPNIQNFVQWAIELVFTAHLGTHEQKKEVFSKIMGLSADSLKEALKTSAGKISCVYLYTLGVVKDLRQSMSIDDSYSDDMVVCKYGNTSDLSRRTSEHAKSFGTIKNANLKLLFYSLIDEDYAFEAETNLRNTFKSMKCELVFKKFNELVVIEPSLMKNIENEYLKLGSLYSGKCKELIALCEKNRAAYETEIIKKNAEIEMIKKDVEIIIMKKDAEISKKDAEISKKNAEIEITKKDAEISKKNAEIEIMRRDLEIERMKNKIMLLEHK